MILKSGEDVEGLELKLEGDSIKLSLSSQDAMIVVSSVDPKKPDNPVLLRDVKPVTALKLDGKRDWTMTQIAPLPTAVWRNGSWFRCMPKPVSTLAEGCPPIPDPPIPELLASLQEINYLPRASEMHILIPESIKR